MDSYDCCKVDKKEYQQVTSLSSLLKLVGEENRLKILCILKQGKHCVCEIEEHVNLSQSLISHHIKDLRDAGLIKDDKKQSWVFYSLTKKGKKITDLIFSLE